MKCTARSKSTNGQCRNNAINGGTVCRMHGGSAPQVKAAAQRRLLEMTYPAIARLAEVLEAPLEDGDEWPKRAAVVLKAVKEVLDRAGVDSPKQVDVTVTDDMMERRIQEILDQMAELDIPVPDDLG